MDAYAEDDFQAKERERDAHEAGYLAGNKAAWVGLLRLAIQNMGDGPANAEAWRLERAETVACLRAICANYGDNDWPDTLHLRDVLEKHLERHLP